MKRWTILCAILALALAGCLDGELNSNVDFLVMQDTPASSRLVEEAWPWGKQLNLGWYSEPFADPNVTDGTWTVLREKRWHFFSFANSRYMVGLSIVDAGYLANSFAYIYDFQTDQFQEFTHVGLPGTTRVSENSIAGQSTCIGMWYRLAIGNDGTAHTIVLACSDGAGHTLSGAVDLVEAGAPLVNAKEVLPKRVVYTHQNSMCRPSGTLLWDGTEVTFSADEDFGAMDYTRGLHQYQTDWDWAAASGLANDGTPVAFNLAAGLAGDDVTAVYWIGEDIYRAGALTFEYDDLLSEWQIQSGDGVIDLTFEPTGMREGDINVLNVLRSTFYQPFGYFSGTIEGPDGHSYVIEDIKGVTEEHYAKW